MAEIRPENRPDALLAKAQKLQTQGALWIAGGVLTSLVALAVLPKGGFVVFTGAIAWGLRQLSIAYDLKCAAKGAVPSPVALIALAGVTAALVCAALYLIFAVAPVELQMGIVQKIFYFHVPSAYAMYVGFVACFIGSVGYLWKRTPRWDALGVAGAEVGLVFCLIVLITGPLWARKAWGYFWVWDPRLTTTLLAGMVFMAYVVLRGFGSGSEAEKKFAAGLGIVGVLDLPIIHYSVRKWSGQHPTVITGRGGGLHPDMYPALWMSLAAFTALVVLLLWARARVEVMRQRVEAVELEAAERGLLEDA